MHQFDNEAARFGSAAFASEQQIAEAGIFTKADDALLIGFVGDRPIFYSGAGGMLCTAGARGGKLATLLGYNLCHGFACNSTFVVLDMKGELAAISQDQTPDEKFCIYWNPLGLHGLIQHRINPVDYIRADSPSLVSDVKVFCENMITKSGSADNKYFEGRAREFLEGIILTLVKLHGQLTLPLLYRTINLIPGNSDAWLDFAWEMNQSGFPLSVRIEEEIAKAHGEDGNAGGFKGIIGEIFHAFSSLSDPTLMNAVSPPFDFSFGDLCSSSRSYQVYLMPPAEFVQSWAPVLKAMFVAGMIYKSRSPQAPRQTWILDECAQLGGFPLVTKLFTYGAGIGIRPWAVFQATKQMRQIGADAEGIITSSASLRSYFATRDIESATAVSRMLGVETLEYNDELEQSGARLARRQAAEALMFGADPFAIGRQLKHQNLATAHRTKQQRMLRTPDEVLNTPPDKQYIFCDALQSAIYADRKPYYEQEFMAGRYHSNPHHPPLDKVRVMTRRGGQWRRVVVSKVPRRFAHYPQYQNGLWSRVK